MIEEVNNFYFDEPCVVSMFIGEFGWFLTEFQAMMRFIVQEKYEGKLKCLIMTNVGNAPIINDFATYTLDLPKDFYKLHLETDCFEAPPKGSPPGSLTPPEIYAALIAYFRSFYNRDKAIELWPPRGCNTWSRGAQKKYARYTLPKLQSDKPIITVFPRGRDRAANRNVPEFVWKEVVDILSNNFIVVIGGTPGGSYLSDYSNPHVINLINCNDGTRTEKTIQYLNSSVCSISSQSGPTHLSLLCGTNSYIIGHEKDRHCRDENRFSIPTSFRYVYDYRAIDAKTIIEDVREFLTALTRAGLLNIDSLARPALRTLLRKQNLIGAEIGVDRGSNALQMLKNLDIEKLYLIDPYCYYDNCDTTTFSDPNAARNLLLPYKDKIVWIHKKSEDAVNDITDRLDFVYIDGNHRYEYAKKDIECYYPLVKPGGLVAGHDYDPSDGTDKNNVIQAVKDFFGDTEIKSAISSDDMKSSDWWVIKPLDEDSINEILNKDVDLLNRLLKETIS